MLTNTKNQVKLTNVAEMVSGSEVIIDNIQPDECIDYPSNDFYIDKKVYFADRGVFIQSFEIFCVYQVTLLSLVPNMMILLILTEAQN